MKIGQCFDVEFPENYFGQWENDAPLRGHLEVTAVSPDGERYRLSFYDIVRLKQTLDSCIEQSAIHYTEPNLIVIAEVNTANIRRAVADMAAEGYFDTIKPESSG
jgi:hypothetical protein